MTAPRKANGVDVELLRKLEQHRAELVARACDGKKRYADEYAARASGTLCMQKYGSEHQLYFYRCRHCRGYHLTKAEQPPFFAVDYLEKEGYK